MKNAEAAPIGACEQWLSAIGYLGPQPRVRNRSAWAKRSLADRIEHPSRTRADRSGYDIQSFEEDGWDRLN